MTKKQLQTILLLIIFITQIIKINAQKEIFFADVSIYSENGKYYLSGTRTGQPPGFKLLESENLIDWHKFDNSETEMLIGVSNKVYGDRGFWAPQILKENNMYYLTYTANEHIAIAKSSKLSGPFNQTRIEPIDSSRKNIDSYLFKDDDGKYYMYHVRFKKGNYIWVAEFDITSGKMKMETLKQCFTNTQQWEAISLSTINPIMEGPTVVKLKGIYYLFYSANDFRSIDYAVGYATANSPYGPWTKYENNPIIHRSIVKENGSGHGDLFFDKQNKPYYVYHVHNSSTKVNPRRTRIIPLHLKLNTKTGIYDISVDSNEGIIPKITSQVNR